jgi:hypothetical protein
VTVILKTHGEWDLYYRDEVRAHVVNLNNAVAEASRHGLMITLDVQVAATTPVGGVRVEVPKVAVRITREL